MYDIYKCNVEDSARFLLGKNGSNTIIIIGLNPSTANKEKSDTTVAKVEIAAKLNGYDSFIMTNLYPIRSTDPKFLPQDHDTQLFDENIKHILSLIKNKDETTFWAAWGSKIVHRNYLINSCKQIYDNTKDKNVKWFHYGDILKNGHPRHPSRLSYSWNFKPFDIKNYCDNLY